MTTTPSSISPNKVYHAPIAPPAQARARIRGIAASKLFTYLAILLVCGGFILPFVWMLSTSLKTLAQTTEFPPRFVPTDVEFFKYHDRIATPLPKNYVDVVTSDKFDFLRLTRNSLVIAGLSVLGTVISSSLVAYGFAKLRFRGRGALFAIMLGSMMIPFPVMMVSLFSIFRWIGDHTPFQMLGTFRPLWIGTFFGNAFNIFLLRQFFRTIPDELSEAARLDGCSEFGIFWRIMLPLARPALVVVALFTFLGSWNDFLGPLIYLHRPEQYTLALGLQVFQSQHGGTSWNLLMAASLLVILPVIVLYFLTQKTFIEGIATTGMKG
jgi:multiple sugar transport system permease protein